ncbi:hypothetical protein BDW69DRAFT_177627 [Aspergillus filifer]
MRAISIHVFFVFVSPFSLISAAIEKHLQRHDRFALQVIHGAPVHQLHRENAAQAFAVTLLVGRGCYISPLF